MRYLSRLMAWWQGQRLQHEAYRSALTAAGQVVEMDNPRAVRDGVNYAQPVVMPRAVRKAWAGWSQEQREAYLSESSRADFRFQFDTPTQSGGPVVMPTEDPLAEWDFQTRRAVLENTHAAYHRNPIAKTIVNYASSFVVGEGMARAYKNKAVEAIIEEFCESPDNPVAELEKSLVTDLQVDGELFLRFFEGDGELAVVPLRPWECEWIVTERGFYRRPISYHFNFTLTEGDSPTGQDQRIEDVPADQIYHRAINRHSYELRGRPDLYVILPWLKAYKDWLEDRARQNYWRNALLFFVQVANANAAAIASVVSRWRKPPAPGSVAVESSNVTLTPVTNSAGGADAGEDGRQLKLMIAVGAQTPEYMLSDGENANLASTNNQELPALTKFTHYQSIMRSVWEDVFDRALTLKADAGMIDGAVMVDGAWMVPEEDSDGEPVNEPGPEPGIDGAQRMVKLCDTVSVAYEPMTQSEPKDLAEMLQIAVNNKWVSNETASRELGFDFQRERKIMDAEEQTALDKMARGEMMIPPGLDPMGQGAPMADDDEAEGTESDDNDAPPDR